MTTIATTTGAAPANRSILGRDLDFLFLGGASLIVWAIAWLASPMRADSPSIAKHFSNFPALFSTLSLFVNFPHFMATYQFAYREQRASLAQGFFQLYLVPAALILCFALAFIWYSTPLGVIPGYPAGDAVLGRATLALLANLMFFLVGWHYAKQSFGCAAVYSRLEGYPLDDRFRFCLKALLFGAWWANFIEVQTSTGSYQYFGLTYPSLGLPRWLISVPLVVSGLGALGLGALVWKTKKASGKIPSLNLMVGPLAFLAWWLPPLRQHDYYIYAVPFFHSLQYLIFVYKVETVNNLSRVPSPESRIGTEFTRQALFTSACLIVAGYLAFEGVPEACDRWTASQAALGVPFFVLSFNLFINIHHYFLDNLIWRRGSPSHRALVAN